MSRGAAAHKSEKKSRRTSLIVRLAALAVFLVVLISVSILTVLRFLSEPQKIIVLTPEMTQQARAVVAAAATAAPQAERIVRANRFTLHGTVLDAQTHQPIPVFSVRMGYSYYQGGFSQQQPPNFSVRPALHFKDGRYSMITPFDAGSAKWSVRIEAPGHLPIISAPQSASGELNFALAPANDLKGTLVDSTGAPVDGAAVVIGVPGLSTDIDSADLHALTRYPIKTTTGKGGEFDLPPQTGNFSLAAFSDAGFVEVDLIGGDAPIQLHLAPWGSIKGHLTIAGKPGAARPIMIGSSEPTPDTSQAHMDGFIQGKTDDTGDFSFDRVMPGDVRVSRQVRQDYPNGGYTIRNTQTEYARLAAGQNAIVNVGGHGRAVVGKLILPPDSGALKDYYLNAEINGQSTPPPSEVPPQMPDKIKTGSQAGRDMWMSFFSITPAGKQFLAQHPQPQPVARQYTLELDAGASGGFRVEDVLPGDYRIWLYPNPSAGGRSLQPVNQEFTVPPVPGGGYSDQPLVLPDITLFKQ